MTKDELLKPRWKVIADYPYCPYQIGDMVEVSDLGIHFHCTTTKVYNSFNAEMENQVNYFSIELIKNFPHLFRELHWSEDREISDLPKYVKGVDGYYKGKTFKIAHLSQNGRIWHVDNEIEHQTFLRWATDFIPADESDYNDYLLTLK